MSGTTRKWLVGCGIGCGLFVLALGAAGTCGYFAVRGIVDNAENLDDGFAALVERFGAPQDFVPPPDGCVPAERVEAFLAVRDEMAPVRQEVAGQFRVLDGEGPGRMFAKIKAAAGVVPSVLGFIGERNRALLAAGMGAGEYQHIYCLAYFGLLGKDPADGPGFALVDEEEDRDQEEAGDVHRGRGRNFHWSAELGSDDEVDVRERRGREVRRRINEVQRTVLANQAAAWRDGGLVGQGRAPDEWESQLQAEVRAMRDEALRLPWEEGLPGRIAECLEPYRDRLEAAYEPLTAILDVGLVEDED